uniref:G protein-coupled receptor n=1 Tax=Panagrellus redivivus TaxID=6233 RepID=A0A7E4ZUA4_PANRE
MPGSVLSYVYIFPYFYTTVAIYIITIIQYLAIWITTFNKRKQIPGYMRIMKPITINVIVSLFGWLANVGFEIVATKMTWNPTVAEFWGGIGINLAVASEFWVYFTFNRSSTCHYLIISRAIFDVCHQSGHFVTATLMFRGQETIFHNYCFAMELIPFFAILGTPIITLAIGIDRFLVFHFREFHNRLNVKIYLTVIYCFAIFYAVVLIVLFYTTTTDMGKQVFCAPGSIITIDYAFAYLYTNMALYLVSIALYLSIWITAYMNRSLLAGCMHIMKPITIILGVQLFGWVSNFALSVIATSSNWDPKIFPLWGGIGINAAVASEYWIYNIYK